MKSSGAIGVVAALAVFACGRDASLTTSGLDPDRVVVAVLENQTGDTSLDAVGRMASNWITVGLEIAGVVHVVPTPTALKASQFVRTEVEGGRVDDPVRALAEETGAGHVVSGVYDRENGRLRFRVQVANINSGEEPGVLDPVSGDPASFQETIEVLRQRVMGFLAVSVDERLAPRASIARRPPTLEAYRAFDDGLREYTAFNNAAALPHFLRAFELDSTFLVPLIYAGNSCTNLRQWAQLDSLMHVLALRIDELSEYDRYWLQYLQAWALRDHEGAVNAMRGAARIAPGSKAVYNLAYSLERTRRPREELEVLQTLDPNRGPMRDFWPYWERMATALHMLGDHSRELEEVRKGRLQYPNLQSLLTCEVWASAALGQADHVMELLDEALTHPPQAGWTELMRYEGAALELRAHGHKEAAREVNQLVIDWLQARPPEEAAQHPHRYLLAWAIYRAERWSEADVMFEDLVAEVPDDAFFLGSLGVAVARQGDRVRAKQISEQLAELDGAKPFGIHTYWRAGIAAALGERDEAVSLLRDSFDQSVLNGREVHTAIQFESLHGYPPFEELMRVKG